MRFVSPTQWPARILVGIFSLVLVSTTVWSNRAVAQLPGTLTIDHYHLYQNNLSTVVNIPVVLRDQFGEESLVIRSNDRFGVPVDKNGEGIQRPELHYMWYSLLGGIPAERTVVVQNQFGDFTLQIRRPVALLAPALKNVTSGEALADHYKCYEALGGASAGAPVLLEDQFVAQSGTAVAPRVPLQPCRERAARRVRVPIFQAG